LGKHIERSTRHMPRFDQLGECLQVNQFTSRAVDDAHARASPFQSLPIEQMMCFGCQGHMERDEIATGKQFIETYWLGAQLLDMGGGHEGVVCQHLHAESVGAAGDFPANFADADDAQCLAGEFRAHKRAAFPFASAEGTVCLRHFAGKREHQREGQFRCGDGVALR
jgi:hypothetical protein